MNALVEGEHIIGVAQLCGTDAILRREIDAATCHIVSLQLKLVLTEGCSHLRLSRCHRREVVI